MAVLTFRAYSARAPCSVVHLATSYYNATGDKTPFDTQWVSAMQVILQVLQTEQQVSGSPYSFQRMVRSAGHGVRRHVAGSARCNR